MLHLRGIRGALEHHVFEEVGKAAASLWFEPESDLVVHTHGDHRRGGIRSNHHVQAICQLGIFYPNLESFHEFPPVAIALDFTSNELFSKSASIAAGSWESTRAARRLSDS